MVWILAFAVSFGLSFVVGRFPPENAVYGFKSPEDVFNYYCKGEIYDIEYGKESAAILYFDKNRDYQFFIIPKINGEYKIPSTSKLQISKSPSETKHGTFYIYSYKDVSDHYLFGVAFSKENISAVDSEGKPVKALTKTIDGTNYAWIYSYIETTDGYCIIINDQKIVLYT